ncbi:hypothetical protein GY45DRAFT_1124516 [Cubamyces sp. BRFM 1775]|nr:hypothetical protein GY45DRAFT_1124516 [Cubamyces sp. BRFM 1775]
MIQLSEADPHSEGFPAPLSQQEEDRGADADEDDDGDEDEGEDEDEDEEVDELDEDEEKPAPHPETRAWHEHEETSAVHTSSGADPDPNLVPTQPNSPVLAYLSAALLSASVPNVQAPHYDKLTEAEVSSILSDAAAIVSQERHGIQAPTPPRHTSPRLFSEYMPADPDAEVPGLPAIVVASPTPPRQDSPSPPPASLSYLAPTPVRTRGRPRKTVVDFFDEEEFQERRNQQLAVPSARTPPRLSTPPQGPGGHWANMDKQSITALPPTTSPSFDVSATDNMSSTYEYYPSVPPLCYEGSIQPLSSFAMPKPQTIFNSVEDDRMDMREDSPAGPLMTYQCPYDPPARPPLPPPPPPPSSHPILLPTIPQIAILSHVVPSLPTPQPLYTQFVAPNSLECGGDMDLDEPEPLAMDWAEADNDVEMASTEVLAETYQSTYYSSATPGHIHAVEQQAVFDATVARVDPVPSATRPNDEVAVYYDSLEATPSSATPVALDATSVPESAHPQPELDTAPQHVYTIGTSVYPPPDAIAVAETASVPDATPAPEASIGLTSVISDVPSSDVVPPPPVVAVDIPAFDYLAPPPGEVEANTVDPQVDDDDEDDEDEDDDDDEEEEEDEDEDDDEDDDPSQWEVVVAPLPQSQPSEQPAEASELHPQVVDPVPSAPVEIAREPVEEPPRAPTPQPSQSTPSEALMSTLAVDMLDVQRKLADAARVSGGPYSRRGGPSGLRRAIMEREKSKKLIDSIKADLGLKDESPQESRGNTPATTTQSHPIPATTTDCTMADEPAEEEIPALRPNKGKGKDTSPVSHAPEVPMPDVPSIAPEVSEELVKSLLTPEELALNSSPAIWAQFRSLKSSSARPATRDLNKPGSSRQHGFHAMQDVPAIQVGSIVESASLSPARDKGHDALPLPGRTLVDVPAVSHVQPQHALTAVEKNRPVPGPLDWDDEDLTTSPVAEKWQPMMPSPVKDVFGFKFTSKPPAKDAPSEPVAQQPSGLSLLAAAASSIEVSASAMEGDDDDDEDFPEPLWKRSVSKPTIPKEQRPMRQLPKRAIQRSTVSSYSSLAGALDEARVIPSSADVHPASEPSVADVTPSEPEPLTSEPEPLTSGPEALTSGSEIRPVGDGGEAPPSPCVSLYSEDEEPAYRPVESIVKQPAMVPMATLEHFANPEGVDKEASNSMQRARNASEPSSTQPTSQPRSADEHDIALTLLAMGTQAAPTSSEETNKATDRSSIAEPQQPDAHVVPSASEERASWSPPACASPPILDEAPEQDVTATSALDSMDTTVDGTLTQMVDEMFQDFFQQALPAADDPQMMELAQLLQLSTSMPTAYDGVHAPGPDSLQAVDAPPEEPMTGQSGAFDAQDVTISDKISEAEFETYLDEAMVWHASEALNSETTQQDAGSSALCDTSSHDGVDQDIEIEMPNVGEPIDAASLPDVAAPSASSSADDASVTLARQDAQSTPHPEEEHVHSPEAEILAEVEEVEHILCSLSPEGTKEAGDATNATASDTCEVSSSASKGEDPQVEEASPAGEVAEELTKDPGTDGSIRAAIDAPDVSPSEPLPSFPDGRPAAADQDDPSHGVPSLEAVVTTDPAATPADPTVSETGESAAVEICVSSIADPPASTEAEVPDLISFDDPPVIPEPAPQSALLDQPTPAVIVPSSSASPSGLDEQPSASEQELPTIVITAPSECGEPEEVEPAPETPPPAEPREPSPPGYESEESVEPCSSLSPSPPSSPSKPRRTRAGLPPTVSKNVLRFVLGGESSGPLSSPYQKLPRAERRVRTRQSRRKRRDQLRNVPETLLDEVVSSELSSSAPDSPSSESDSSPTRGIEEPLVPYWYVTHVRRVAQEMYLYAPRPVAPALPEAPRVEQKAKMKPVQTGLTSASEALPRVTRPYRSLLSHPPLRPPRPAPEVRPYNRIGLLKPRLTYGHM